MPSEFLNPAKKSLIAFAAVWSLFCAFGSGFLHESIGCSHDGGAETVEHQEEDRAHWAGLTSDVFAATDCPVCITAQSFGTDGTTTVSLVMAKPSEALTPAQNRLAAQNSLHDRSTRAPPRFFVRISIHRS